jgi:hypothetical protein
MNLDLKNLKIIKHIECSWEKYSSQGTYDNDTLYFITDKHVIHKGQIPYSIYEDLRNLKTNSKNSLIDAINEVNTKASNGGFNQSIVNISQTNIQKEMAIPLLQHATQSYSTIIECYITMSFNNNSVASITSPSEVEVTISDGENTYRGFCFVSNNKVNNKYIKQTLCIKSPPIPLGGSISVYAYTNSDNLIVTSDSYILITEH